MTTTIGRRVICATRGHDPVWRERFEPYTVTQTGFMGEEYKYVEWYEVSEAHWWCIRCKERL